MTTPSFSIVFAADGVVSEADPVVVEGNEDSVNG